LEPDVLVLEPGRGRDVGATHPPVDQGAAGKVEEERHRLIVDHRLVEPGQEHAARESSQVPRICSMSAPAAALRHCMELLPPLIWLECQIWKGSFSGSSRIENSAPSKSWSRSLGVNWAHSSFCRSSSIPAL